MDKNLILLFFILGLWFLLIRNIGKKKQAAAQQEEKQEEPLYMGGGNITTETVNYTNISTPGRSYTL